MNIQHLALLLFLTLVPHTHATSSDSTTYTVFLIKDNNHKNPPQVTIKADPNTTTIGDFRKLLAEKDERLWLGRQRAIYSDPDNPFHNKQSLSTSFQHASRIGKNIFYIQYDDSIQPRFKFIYKDKKVLKKKLMNLNYGYLMSTIEPAIRKKINKIDKREKRALYKIGYIFDNKQYERLTEDVPHQKLKFKTKEQLAKTVCTIQVIITAESTRGIE